MQISLKQLTMDGVGPFRQKEVFDFPSEGVTYVYAPNGHGKTSTIDLVRWLIRGPRAVEANEFRSLKQDHEKSIINHNRFRNMDGGRVEAIIEVDEKRYRVERSIEWGTSPESDLVVERDEDGEWAPLDEPDEFLADLLPHERLGFNLLTGEHVRDFVEELSGPVVKESVERLLQNPELVSLHDRLSDVVDDLESQARAEDRAKRRIEKLKDKRADLKEKLSNFEERVREKEVEEHRLQDKIESLNQDLARLDDVEDLRDEQTELEEAIGDLRERKRRELAAISKTLTPSWSTLLKTSTQDEVEGFLTTYDEQVQARNAFEEDAGEIRHLESLLERDVCYCGTEMDAEHRETVRDRIEELESGEPEVPDLPEEEWALRRWASADGRGDLADEVRDHQRRLADVQSDLEDKQERLDEVESKLKQADANERDRIEKQLKATKMKLRSLEDDKSKHVRNQLDVQERLNEVKSKIADTDAESVDGPLLRRARGYRNAIRETIDNAVPKLRQDLVDQTQRIFDELFQKDSQYRITLSGTSMVPQVVRDIDGEEETVILSEGEKTRLGLALLFALRDVASERPFLLLDAPFSTLDDEGVHRLLELIADHQGQIVVFTKDAFPQGRWYDAVERADPKVYRMDWVTEGPGDREGFTQVNPAKVDVLRLQGG